MVKKYRGVRVDLDSLNSKINEEYGAIIKPTDQEGLYTLTTTKGDYPLRLPEDATGAQMRKFRDKIRDKISLDSGKKVKEVEETLYKPQKRDIASKTLGIAAAILFIALAAVTFLKSNLITGLTIGEQISDSTFSVTFVVLVAAIIGLLAYRWKCCK